MIGIFISRICEGTETHGEHFVKMDVKIGVSCCKQRYTRVIRSWKRKGRILPKSHRNYNLANTMTLEVMHPEHPPAILHCFRQWISVLMHPVCGKFFKSSPKQLTQVLTLKTAQPCGLLKECWNEIPGVQILALSLISI